MVPVVAQLVDAFEDVVEGTMLGGVGARLGQFDPRLGDFGTPPLDELLDR